MALYTVQPFIAYNTRQCRVAGWAAANPSWHRARAGYTRLIGNKRQRSTIVYYVFGLWEEAKVTPENDCCTHLYSRTLIIVQYSRHDVTQNTTKGMLYMQMCHRRHNYRTNRSDEKFTMSSNRSMSFKAAHMFIRALNWTSMAEAYLKLLVHCKVWILI